MVIVEMILASLAATSLMTLFSYAVSGLFNQLYKEPVLLGNILTSYQKTWSKDDNRTAGWILHYLIGLSFVVIYYFPSLIGVSWFPMNITTGIIFGAICGTIGIFSWMLMFRDTKRTRPANLPGYYLQLLIAHIIFGVTTSMIHSYFST